MRQGDSTGSHVRLATSGECPRLSAMDASGTLIGRHTTASPSSQTTLAVRRRRHAVGERSGHIGSDRRPDVESAVDSTYVAAIRTRGPRPRRSCAYCAAPLRAWSRFAASRHDRCQVSRSESRRLDDVRPAHPSPSSAASPRSSTTPTPSAPSAAKSSPTSTPSPSRSSTTCSATRVAASTLERASPRFGTGPFGVAAAQRTTSRTESQFIDSMTSWWRQLDRATDEFISHARSKAATLMRYGCRLATSSSADRGEHGPRGDRPPSDIATAMHQRHTGSIILRPRSVDSRRPSCGVTCTRDRKRTCAASARAATLHSQHSSVGQLRDVDPASRSPPTRGPARRSPSARRQDRALHGATRARSCRRRRALRLAPVPRLPRGAVTDAC